MQSAEVIHGERASMSPSQRVGEVVPDSLGKEEEKGLM